MVLFLFPHFLHIVLCVLAERPVLVSIPVFFNEVQAMLCCLLLFRFSLRLCMLVMLCVCVCVCVCVFNRVSLPFSCEVFGSCCDCLQLSLVQVCYLSLECGRVLLWCVVYIVVIVISVLSAISEEYSVDSIVLSIMEVLSIHDHATT